MAPSPPTSFLMRNEPLETRKKKDKTFSEAITFCINGKPARSAIPLLDSRVTGQNLSQSLNDTNLNRIRGWTPKKNWNGQCMNPRNGWAPPTSFRMRSDKNGTRVITGRGTLA
ncbi:hypothetical protein CDAR_492901 [Caerostris darwini]|uniref:Uncharacterized protein n=1 Tax=Caerostris darwini TaxID=1538125 RepID=A0AAV4TCL4_9ARAC|nr:hypothetical protein CDAR_492901 [Caerostris darwini]